MWCSCVFYQTMCKNYKRAIRDCGKRCIIIIRLNDKKSIKKRGLLWRPNANNISSNSTTASVPAYLEIESQGSAASIFRIARLACRDEEMCSKDCASSRHTLATRLSAHASRGSWYRERYGEAPVNENL